MDKNRLEAFSDGIIAIIITIMVLELRVPHGHGGSLAVLKPLIPVFFSYVLSYIYLGIYWSNHHHLFKAVHRINGRILWANLLLLFWLSLIPFTTAWVGVNHMESWPVALYGVILLLAAISYSVLTRSLISHHGRNSLLAKAVGKDEKGNLSVVLYAAAIPLAFINTWISCAMYILVAVMWMVPDERIEKIIEELKQEGKD